MMEVMEIAKATLSEMLETAGESGVTEGQATAAIVKHGIDYYAALDTLQSIYQEMGVERTPAHSGEVIVYRRPKKKPEQQETAALKMAKKAAQSNVSEYKTAAIINKYRR